MNDKNTIKDLEIQAQNTRILMDRLNRSAYGMTWDEMIRLLCGRREEETHDTNREEPIPCRTTRSGGSDS